jgi:PTS system nitrogen regulatory IIA component
MEVSEILKPEAVKSISQSVSKKRLLQELSALAATVYNVAEDAAFDALQERESLGPTGVGQGIAIPHARIDGLESVVAVFFRLEKPMEYDSVDRMPVDLVFGLFAPINSGVEHLKALAVVSRLLRDPSIRAKLRANNDPSILHTILTEINATKAA